MQIIGVSQTTSEVQVRVEGPVMNHLVEVSYSGGDWTDLVADIRSWLDRRQIEAEEFDFWPLDRGVTVRVGFRDQNQAAAFATAFSGRIEQTAPNGAATPARDTIAGTSGENPSTSEDVPTFDAQPAVRAGVSLMITRQQKAELRKHGYTDEQIRDMKPEYAHRVLGLWANVRPRDLDR